MRPRALIFDLYGTLLEIRPPAVDAASAWDQIWRSALGTIPRLSFARFQAECRRVVAAEHAEARARGVDHPEVYWPAVVEAVMPELATLTANARVDLPFYDADLLHSVHLRPEAAEVLHVARKASLRLGLASNCQPYSWRELARVLAPAGLDRGAFDPRLTFLSFEHGFSKPDPHVFRLLTARLRLLGVAPPEAMMVGDRVDHDLAPARAFGWQTFAISSEPVADWTRLRDLLLNL